MTAKQWLSRAKNIDREIDMLLRDKQETRDRLMRITQNYETDGAQVSKDPHKYDRLFELDKQIDALIDEFVEVKGETVRVISSLDDRAQRELLHLRYLECKSFEEIAVRIHYSYKQTCRIHGKALVAVDKIIKMANNGQ